MGGGTEGMPVCQNGAEAPFCPGAFPFHCPVLPFRFGENLSLVAMVEDPGVGAEQTRERQLSIEAYY